MTWRSYCHILSIILVILSDIRISQVICTWYAHRLHPLCQLPAASWLVSAGRQSIATCWFLITTNILYLTLHFLGTSKKKNMFVHDLCPHLHMFLCLCQSLVNIVSIGKLNLLNFWGSAIPKEREVLRSMPQA